MNKITACLILMSLNCSFCTSKMDISSGTLEEIKFHEGREGKNVSLKKETKYILAIVNLNRDCSSCVKSMLIPAEIAKNYEGVEFILINQSSHMPDNIQEWTGDLQPNLWMDEENKLATLLHLTEEPHLVFITDDLKIVSILSLNDIDSLANPQKHYHTIIQSI